MTDESTTNEDEKREAWLQKIEERLGAESMPDFKRLLEALERLDDKLSNPPEALGVDEAALRTFLEVGSHQITNVVMSKPGGEDRLIPMALASGMLIGMELAGG